MALPFPIPDTLSSAFVMSRCTPADVNAIAEVYYEGFLSDPRNTFWWPPEKEDMIAWNRRRVRHKMADRTTRHFKITDVQSGDVVAFARWDIPEGHEAVFGDGNEDGAAAVDVSQVVTAGENAERDLPVTSAPVEAPTPWITDFPKGSSPELLRSLFDKLIVTQEKHKAKTMLGLSLLCTSPKYHRRGAAQALMLPMLALADAEGLKAYLEATPLGKPLYEKLGFREIDHLSFDLKKYTDKFDEVYRFSVMIRDPKSPS